MKNNLAPLYVNFYNNQTMKISPQRMREVFTRERFRYSVIKMFLHRWDYRVEMFFELKENRTAAINEIKKMKNEFQVVYRYEFSKSLKNSRYLMNGKEYARLISLGPEKKEEPPIKKQVSVKEEKGEKDELTKILQNRTLLRKLLLFELKQANKRLRQ